MQNRNVYDIGTGRTALSGREPDQLNDFAELPDVPVMPETLLLMELKARERSVDLNEISQLVLGDLGACLQIMRRAGTENTPSWAPPARIEDCIAAVGLEACLEAISHRIVTRAAYPSAVMEIWAHSRNIAELCAFQAEERFIPVSTEAAYLIGLFHELDSLPRYLGWNWLERISLNNLGLRMAEAWFLPQCVVDFFESSHAGPNQWMEMVERAHCMARTSAANCPIEEHLSVPVTLGAAQSVPFSVLELEKREMNW